MFCTHCGAENEDGAVKCIKCGEPLEYTQSEDKKSDTESEDKKRKGSFRIRKIAVGSNVPEGDAPVNPDTLDLSGFHLEDVELQEVNLDDMDLTPGAVYGPEPQVHLGAVGAEDFEDEQELLSENTAAKKEKKSKAPWVFMGILAVLFAAALAIIVFLLMSRETSSYGELVLSGDNYWRLGDYGRAGESYEKAIELNPSRSEAYFNLAQMYAGMDNMESAIRVLEDGLANTGNVQFEERIEYAKNYDPQTETPQVGGVGGPQTEETVSETETAQSETVPEEVDGGNAVVWAMDPELAADNILPVLGCTWQEDTYNSGVNVYVKDGMAGLIDYNGKIVLEPAYTYVLQCSNQLYVGLADGSTQLLDQDYHPNPQSAHDHSLVNYDYLWDSQSKAVYRIVHTSEGPSYVEETPFEFGEDTLVAVIAGNKESFVLEDILENPIYAVAGSKGVVTDFIYTDADKASWDGMIAVCRDGLWGYCNAEGEEVVPCVYEGALYTDRAGEQEQVSFTPGRAYGYSEGYVPVKKDGVWGYLDKEGQIAVPFVFEEARPVHGHHAWVKYQGQWGIIVLPGTP